MHQDGMLSCYITYTGTKLCGIPPSLLCITPPIWLNRSSISLSPSSSYVSPYSPIPPPITNVILPRPARSSRTSRCARPLSRQTGGTTTKPSQQAREVKAGGTTLTRAYTTSSPTPKPPQAAGPSSQTPKPRKQPSTPSYTKTRSTIVRGCSLLRSEPSRVSRPDSSRIV